MTDKRWYPVIYMFLVTAVFSAMVIGFSQYTEEMVQANEERNFEIAILKVLPEMYDPKLSSVELHNRFVNQVDKPTEDTHGAFTLKKGGVIQAYALPIKGEGFWAPIEAVIGINSDKETITGFAVYEQKETPGLGAEISQRPFTKQFDNLEMATNGKPVVFRRPGETLQKGQVHAVTGATQTSVRLEKIINNSLKEWRNKMTGE